MARLFGTDGIRGVVGQDMTPELAQRLGLALGTHLPAGARVALGRDARASGPMLASAAAAGLLAAGATVVRLGVCPTPAIQLYTARRDEVKAAVIVTASHNPAEWNGLKYIDGDGTEASRRQEERVERLYDSGRFRRANWRAVGALESDDSANAEYVGAVRARIRVAKIRARRFRVVVDPGGGPGALTSPRLLESLGARVDLVHGELDGALSGRDPEPVEENLSKLKARVRRIGADLGIAHDGDADRCIFVDDRGSYVPGDQSFALLAQHILSKTKGGVVCTPVSTGSVVADVVRRAQGRVVYTAVGSPIVGRRMRVEGAVFGGEENGGLIFPDHQYCRDGLMAAARMLELLATKRRSLSELRRELPRYHVVKTKIPCPNDRKAFLAKALRGWAKRRYRASRVDETDGIKVYIETAWVLARPSGTEPYYRVYAEAKSEAGAQRLAEEFVAAARKLLSGR